MPCLPGIEAREGLSRIAHPVDDELAVQHDGGDAVDPIGACPQERLEALAHAGGERLAPVAQAREHDAPGGLAIGGKRPAELCAQCRRRVQVVVDEGETPARERLGRHGMGAVR